MHQNSISLASTRKDYGFTVERVVEQALAVLRQRSGMKQRGGTHENSGH